MAIISTEKLLDEYFSQQEYGGRIRGMIDRPELYQYEIEIGKQLVEMNTDELFELILRFNSRRSKQNFALRYTTYSTIATHMRNIFDYYTEHYEPIVNPWRKKEMKMANVIERLSSINAKVSWQQFEDVFPKFYKDYTQENAEYLECLVRLYYEGFKNADEVVMLAEDMINFRTKEIRLNGRIVHLSDKTFGLLVKIHNTTSLYGNKNVAYQLEPLGKSYFRFICRPVNATKYRNEDGITLKDVSTRLNSKLSKEVRTAYGVDATSRVLYYLGIFDKFVDRYGMEKVKEMVYSNNNKEYNDILFAFAAENGLNINNVMYLKKQFMLYI